MMAADELGTCRSCRAPIRWAHTQKGHRIPLDPEPVEGGNLVEVAPGIVRVVEPGDPSGARFVSHFATCPNAGAHRRRGRDRGRAPQAVTA